MRILFEKKTEYPVLNKEDHILSSYVALTLGRDAHIGGVKDVGPAKILNAIKSIKTIVRKDQWLVEQVIEKYADFVVKKYLKKQLTKEYFKVISSAIIYKPVVEQQADKETAYKYLFNKPSKL